jgi:hypothetical protein
MRLLRFLPTRWWSPSAWKTWLAYMHWRLETYGLYYPEGKWNNKTFFSLVRQTPSYYRWLGEIDRTRQKPQQ